MALVVIGFTLTLPPSHTDMVSEYSYNRASNLVTIKLSERMGMATDTNCERAAQLFHAICSQGYYLYVKPYRTGGWIPSQAALMDVSWTSKLIEMDPRLTLGKKVRPRAPSAPSYGEPKGYLMEYEVNGRTVRIRRNQ